MNRRRALIGGVAAALAGLGIGLVIALTAPAVFNQATFDSGGIGDFTGPQCANAGTPSKLPRYRGNYYVVDSVPGGTIGQGTKSLEIQLPTTPAGYPLTACDLQTPRTPINSGIENVGLMFWVPFGFQVPNNDFIGTNIMELHSQFIWGSPVSLQLHGSPSRHAPNSVVIALQTGACSPAGSSSHGCQYRSNVTCNRGSWTCIPTLYAIPPGKLVDGKWNEIALHFVWSSSRNGVIQSFYRVKGGSWAAGSSEAGIPTVQWSKAGPPGGSVEDELELYTAAVKSPLTVWFDDVVKRSTLAAVEQALP